MLSSFSVRKIVSSLTESISLSLLSFLPPQNKRALNSRKPAHPRGKEVEHCRNVEGTFRSREERFHRFVGRNKNQAQKLHNPIKISLVKVNEDSQAAQRQETIQKVKPPKAAIKASVG